MTVPPIVVAMLAAAHLSVADSTTKFVPPRTIPELEARIRKVLDSAKVPGLGLAIVRHDSVVYTGGLGRARVSPALTATDSTLFRIGSTSKAFVALTAQALVREGKLSLDEPLAKALPGFYFKNQWESTDPVRIVHLLEHTSGFDDNSLQSYARSDPAPTTVEQGLALDSATRVSRWRPGTRFSYCNTGPAIVALIIERIEGKPFEQVIQDRWFTPIGMRTATYFRPDSTRLPVATLYRADGTTPVPFWYVFIRPAGSISASAHDMAAYVRFLLGRGTIDGRQLLPAESLERMERSESSLMARAGLTVGYGLHLYRIADTTGYTWTQHNGGVEGGLSDMSYLPAYGVGYAFQINSGNGEAFGLIRRLVRAYLTQGLTPPVPPPVAPLAPSTRQQFAGWYRGVSPRTQHLYVIERILELVHVTFTDSSMYVGPIFDPPGQPFVPVDSVRFRRRDEPEATVVFVRDTANGRAQGLESVTGGLGSSMVRVTALNALGTVAIVILWLIGLALSVVAMVVGVIRWVVQRARHRPAVRSVASTPWRVAAVIAALVVAQAVLFTAGSESVQALGSVTAVSVSIWAIGIVASLLSLLGVWAVWRTPNATTPWSRVSLRTVSTIAMLNFVAFAYLVFGGWIGWRTWV